MEEIRAILSEPLDTEDKSHLKAQLSKAESKQVEIYKSYRESKEELELARNRMLLPKHKDYTELDRTTRLESDTASIQRETDDYKDLIKVLDNRLLLGRSFLEE